MCECLNIMYNLIGQYNCCKMIIVWNKVQGKYQRYQKFCWLSLCFYLLALAIDKNMAIIRKSSGIFENNTCESLKSVTKNV